MSEVIENGLDELLEQYERQLAEDWAYAIVVAAAWHHSHNVPACTGYTTTTGGRAFCGACEWGMSADMGDVGSKRSAAFALYALGRIGAAVQLAQDFAVAYTRGLYGLSVSDVGIDGNGAITFTLTAVPLTNMMLRVDL